MKKEIGDMTSSELIEVIDSQDSWDSEEFGELLRRADIDPTAEPYVVDGECMIQPEDIYKIARKKVLGK